jgi:two-component system sensor kinase FixL
LERVTCLIEEASALALVGGREQGILTRFEFDHAVGSILADRVQVQQILLNLLRNALDALQNSKRRELTLATKLTSGQMAERICVFALNEAIGFRPELQYRLAQRVSCPECGPD